MVWSRASWVSDMHYDWEVQVPRHRINFGFKVLINVMYISGTCIFGTACIASARLPTCT